MLKRPAVNRSHRLPVALALLFLACLIGKEMAAVQNPLTEKQFTLENGLKVFLYERHNIPLVNIVAAVNAGSKDETDATSGLVHLLEHYVLFRGTETKSGSEIAADIRRHGGYFNAHTGQDLALFELSLPAGAADFGLANQKEILFNLKIDGKEVEAEKEVLLEELSQIRDDPFRYAAALCYQKLFAGHPYGRPVFGTAETIKTLAADEIERFYRTYFVPGNCALAVVGDFSLNDMEAKVRAVFETVPKSEFAPAKFGLPPPLKKTVEIKEVLDVQEAYLVIGAAGPDYQSADQYASDILTEILGRGISPLLYRPLKGQRDLINSVGMAYITFAYGGAFEIFITLEPKRLPAAKSAALQFLRQVRGETFSRDDVLGEAKFYTYDYLESAKNRISFDTQKARENGLTMATSLAMAMLLERSDVEPRHYLNSIKQVSSSDLRKTAAKYLSRTEYVVVSVVPKKK